MYDYNAAFCESVAGSVLEVTDMRKKVANYLVAFLHIW